MFIATIAVVAPFMPDEIEVLAYNAYYCQTSKETFQQVNSGIEAPEDEWVERLSNITCV